MAVFPPAPESKGNAANETPETEDLKKFRQEWLQEHQGRNAASMRTLDTRAAGSSGQSEELPNVAENRNLFTNVNRFKGPRNTSDHPLVSNGEIRNEDSMPPSLKRALDIYHRAISHEQTGELDEALLLYRQAFRLVPSNLFS
jgi:F-box protein 9